MRKSLRFLSVLVALLLSTSAMAQFKGSTHQAYDKTYKTQPVEFSLTEVATALETDTATLCAALSEMTDSTMLTASPAVKFELVYDGQTYPNADMKTSTADGEGNWWMNAAGKPFEYGDSCAIYSALDYDAPNNKFIIAIGQFPGHFEEGGTANASFKLTFGAKSVTFDIDVTVDAKVAVVLNLSDLTIVKEYTVNLPFVEGKQYEGKKFAAELKGIREAIGLPNVTYSVDELIDYTFAETVKVDSVESGDAKTAVYSHSGQLVEPRDATDAWYGRYNNYDEAADKELPLDYNLLHEYGAGCTFYAQGYSLAADTFQIDAIGQYPDILKEGDTDAVCLYIVNGTNAVKIKLTAEVTKPEKIDIDECQVVGEENLEFTATVENSSYVVENFTLDMDAIATALGCEKADLDQAWVPSDGGFVVASSANNGGAWLGIDGNQIGWGDNAMFFWEPLESIPDGKFKIGQYPGHFSEITEPTTMNTKMIFQNLNKIYVYNISFTVKPVDTSGQVAKADWTVTETLTYDVQLIHAEGYEQNVTSTVDMDAVKKAIEAEKVGPTDLYAWQYYQSEWVPDSLTNAYSCDPNPGFYMSEDGKARSTWGTSCAYGMSFDVSSGEVKWYDHPGSANVAGKAYTGEFFIVNTANGKAAKLVFNVTYVDERVEVETVGETIEVPFLIAESTYDSVEGMYMAKYDLTKTFEALGMTEEEYDAATWYVTKNATQLVAAESFEAEDCLFTEEGYNTPEFEEGKFAVGYNLDEKAFTVSTLGVDPEESTTYSVTVALRYEGKQVKFHLFISGSEATLTAINGVKSETSTLAGKTYDLSGRLVKNPARGLYIVNGKKVMVK